MFGRNKENVSENGFDASKAQIKLATRPRMTWALLTSFLLLISVVFLILVEVGNTSINPTLNKIYFINLNLSDIIPVSVPNANLINSIARTLGLHDFYTVGLWNFCEGYNGQGVTRCSDPQTLYWFNPVEILKNELIAGASIALPQEVNNVLDLVRIVSKWMFGLFLTGTIVNFIMIFIVPFSVQSRWATLPIMIATFFGALFTTVATIIATVMFIIMKNAVTSATELNIEASIGIQMFALYPIKLTKKPAKYFVASLTDMWIAAGTAILAWLIQIGMCCCCASRRDVKTGRKRGSKRAWRDSEMSETTKTEA